MPGVDTPKRIVLLNAVSEAERYLASDARSPSDLCVAMSPAVLAYLRRGGVTAHSTAGYFDTAAHERALLGSRAAIARIEEIDRVPTDDPGIGRAYRDIFIFWSRYALHYLLWAIEVIDRAIAAHSPAAIAVVASGAAEALPARHSLLIEPEEGYFAQIALAVAKTRGIPCETIGQPLRVSRSRFRADLRSLCRYTGFVGWQHLTAFYVRMKGERPVFFVSSNYQMGALMEARRKAAGGAPLYRMISAVGIGFRLPDRMARVLFPAAASKAAAVRERYVRLRERLAREGEPFEHNGVRYGGLLAGKIAADIEGYMAGLALWTERLDSFLSALRPRLLVSNGTRNDEMILAALCRMKRIPFILVSHGSHVPPTNEYERIEWGEHGRTFLRAPYSHIALQSPLAEEYQRSFGISSIGVRTGPLIWGKPADRVQGDALRARLLPDTVDRRTAKIIVHVGTPKRTKGLRFYVYETPDEYIGAIADLARAVERLENTVLVVKFRASEEIGESDIRSLVGFSDRVILSTGGSMAAALGMADLLVSFASTAIEEALQNRIPVLLYGGGGRYRHVPAHGIAAGGPVPRSAAYHVREAGHLAGALKDILALGVGGDRDAELFAPYIYPEERREDFLAVAQGGVQ